MKKLYIQPSIEIEIMDASDLLAGSPTLVEDNYDDTSTPDNDPSKVDPTIGAGGEGNFAKGNNHWDFDNAW